MNHPLSDMGSDPTKITSPIKNPGTIHEQVPYRMKYMFKIFLLITSNRQTLINVNQKIIFFVVNNENII